MTFGINDIRISEAAKQQRELKQCKRPLHLLALPLIRASQDSVARLNSAKQIKVNSFLRAKATGIKPLNFKIYEKI